MLDSCTPWVYNQGMTLRDLRPEGTSLTTIAREMGKPRSSVQKMEASKNPGIYTVKRYAEALGIPADALICQLLQADEKSVQNS